MFLSNFKFFDKFGPKIGFSQSKMVVHGFIYIYIFIYLRIYLFIWLSNPATCFHKTIYYYVNSYLKNSDIALYRDIAPFKVS